MSDSHPARKEHLERDSRLDRKEQSSDAIFESRVDTRCRTCTLCSPRSPSRVSTFKHAAGNGLAILERRHGFTRHSVLQTHSSPSQTPTMSADTFHRFGRLPSELRHLIWLEFLAQQRGRIYCLSLDNENRSDEQGPLFNQRGYVLDIPNQTFKSPFRRLPRVTKCRSRLPPGYNQLRLPRQQRLQPGGSPLRRRERHYHA